MQLYIYDHCPYCVHARMIFGIKKVPVKLHYLLNDDEVTPKKLIGQKLVPILVKKDHTALGESMDIVQYIDHLAGGTPLDQNIRPVIKQWLENIDKYRNDLTVPRSTRIGLPEFATQQAIDYYVAKKSVRFGDFKKLMANSPQLIKHLHNDLQTLTPLIKNNQGTNGIISIEDILLFPILRNLTMVKNIDWPDTIQDYLNKIGSLTDIPLYTNRAI